MNETTDETTHDVPPQATKTVELRVGDGRVGMRLDQLLARELDVSRAHARRLLEEGRVQLDGRALGLGAKGRLAEEGMTLEVHEFQPPEDLEARPEPFRDEQGAIVAGRPIVAVLGSGPGWVAVDKRAGAPVHPLREGEGGTVLNAIRAEWPSVQGVGEGGLRSGVVHRLDVDTSGVMLFAIEPESWARIRAGFREHRVEKRYRAIALGRLEGEQQLEVGLEVARHRPARVRVHELEWEAEPGDGYAVGARGEKLWIARQRIVAVETFDRATLVEVWPQTGFLHQIRATLAHLGHPVAGDGVYRGDFEDPSGAPRHMLHAASLRFEEIAAESPDPEDFDAIVNRLRRGG